MGIQDAGVAEAHVPLVDSGVNAVICSRRTGRLRVSDRIDGIGPAIARLLHAALRVPRMCDRSAEIIELDRKSTRLNSSHQIISYAVFCLKKKKKKIPIRHK